MRWPWPHRVDGASGQRSNVCSLAANRGFRETLRFDSGRAEWAGRLFSPATHPSFMTEIHVSGAQGIALDAKCVSLLDQSAIDAAANRLGVVLQTSPAPFRAALVLRHAEAALAAGESKIAARCLTKVPPIAESRLFLDAAELAGRAHEPYRARQFDESAFAHGATLTARDQLVRAQARLAHAERMRQPLGGNGSWARHLKELKLAALDFHALASSDCSNEPRSQAWAGVARVLRLQKASGAEVELALAQAAYWAASSTSATTTGPSAGRASTDRRRER